MKNIRNFVIIAHIDHGKSTLADRFLELTQTVENRKMKEQYLDTMELERERGITIKLQPVRMIYRPPKTLNPKLETLNKPKIQNAEIQNGLEFRTSDLEFANSEQEFVLNLIDTPGHVDFSYEVSRSLAAVEGAILLVDASKGVQAQTLANLNLARQQNLKIIPVINKVDLPNARIEQVKEEINHLLGTEKGEIISISAKTGLNVKEVLEKVIKEVPPPSLAEASYSGRSPPRDREGEKQLKALIFDSNFDPYKGVIAYCRIFSGSARRAVQARAFAAKANFEILEVGYFTPGLIKSEDLKSGDIGYIATGLKDPGQIRVGDTITLDLEQKGFKPLSGYKEPRPVVYASFFPENSEDYDILKDALGKLKLTDASLAFEPESSAGLGRGFRIGFLGMLHVEIISERLKREFSLNLIISSPSVEYQVVLSNGEQMTIRSASMLPDFSKIKEILEPVVEMEIITPSDYLGKVMELVSAFRSAYQSTEYIGKETAHIKYQLPLAEIITDFYDKLKSVSSGYASMSYEPKGFSSEDLVRLDILVAGDIVEPFSRIVPRSSAYTEGRRTAAKLKTIIPPQWFEVAIQAAIGGKIIARESIRARRKDVTGYLYGGDVTRKMKLLKKQKKGKQKMKELGKVNIPQDVFLKMLKR